VRRYSWLAALLGMACAGGGPRGARPPPVPPPSEDAPPDRPVLAGSDTGSRPAVESAAGSWGLSSPPRVPLDQLLGRPRAEVESIVEAPPRDLDDGWVAYHGSWAIHYANDCAVDLRVQLRERLPCDEVARLTGFGDCPCSESTAGQCLWPSRFITATFEQSSGTFFVRLAPEARICP
jgi:hypothetical protein